MRKRITAEIRIEGTVAVRIMIEPRWITAGAFMAIPTTEIAAACGITPGRITTAMVHMATDITGGTVRVTATNP